MSPGLVPKSIHGLNKKKQTHLICSFIESVQITFSLVYSSIREYLSHILNILFLIPCTFILAPS